MRKRGVLVIGAVLLLLGLLSLFVPVPTRERHGLETGPVSVGIEVTRRERVHPAISAALIIGGVVLLGIGSRKLR